MNIRRALFENANHLLAKGGLCLTRTNADYVSSIPGEKLKSLTDASLATVWGDWYEAMAANPAVGYCPPFGRNVFTQRIIDFIEAYRSFNGKNIRTGGFFEQHALVVCRRNVSRARCSNSFRHIHPQ
jgi:hypothetical protein